MQRHTDSETSPTAPAERLVSGAWPITLVSAPLLDLASGDLLGVTRDGAALWVRIARAEDGAYTAAAGEGVSVRQGLVEGLRTVPPVPEHYQPAP